MIAQHQPSLNIRLRYPVVLRFTSLMAIGIIICVFYLAPTSFEVTYTIPEIGQVLFEQIDIPQTQHLDRLPPPARPSIPIASESEDIADDLTLEEVSFADFEVWDDAPPPPSSTGPNVKFIPFDEAPYPMGGYHAIHANVVYPEIAKEAGIEGTVIVQAFIDRKGRVTETLILQGLPKTGLDEAAMIAVRKTRFIPAKQRDRAVGVWISIPIHFRLKNTS